MKTFWMRLAFAGAIAVGGSGASATQLDQAASTKAASSFAAVSYTAKTRPMQIVDYQLSDQERSLLAFVRLRAEAERSAR